MKYNKLTLLNLLYCLLLPLNANSKVDSIEVICDIWPPYQTINNNQVGGFSTEIIKLVFKRLNVKVKKIRNYPWKRAITMIEKGEIDALYSANFTKDRTNFAYYPDEMIIVSPWFLWIKEEDNLKFNSLTDLSGKSIGVVRGYSYTKEFWQYIKNNSIYKEAVNDEQNFSMLNAGRVDFISAELGNGLYTIQKLGLSNIKALTKKPIKVDGLYIIFNKKTIPKPFVKQFSKELKSLKQEPIYQFIYNQYFIQ
ncbi:substrate-binding periplasmic protein [Zooshikella sp. RANM57]|uniref:substrate-binding periplasmic protein n=1 Tax=Zooshikella sp. RANM57 TaxID=3425863 RepID=UPI003D6ED345